MDFASLKSGSSNKSPIDPVKIFEASPSLTDTFNDLWRGQADALTKWHEVRNERDVLVSLNTGAGKTVVGTLIAQSLVNEGLQNVIYCCSTIDLVNQTSREANRIGLAHSCRVRKGFTNDVFENGQGFCITTYQALFNGHSALRARHFPEAIIFDDAHVADSLLRDAFTLVIDSTDKPEIFNEIVELFRPHFAELGISGNFRRSIDKDEFGTCMAAPCGLYERIERLREILLRHNINRDPDLSYPFAWLEDHLDAYAAVFSRGKFELTPPFLPSRALDVFSKAVKRRVYLSATMESKSDFIRAFGREPDRVITPENDAGNGERLVVSGRVVPGGITPGFVNGLAQTRKVVIAVPNYPSARRWESVATPPSVENFSNELDAFRKKGSGAFVLVSRVDGIDLPHQTCRIMVMEGLPAGTTLLERYQWEFLRMASVQSVRIANRLAQLFGRINRGRNDYGAFLIEGDDLSKWLGNDRNLARLPPLLQKQILVGRTVQDGLGARTLEKIVELVDRVIGRDKGWLDYYQNEVKLAELDKDQLSRHFSNEPHLVDAALAEAKYAEAIWQGDPTRARQAIETTIEKTTNHDTTLGGWHAVWLGATFELDGDRDSALPFYGQAMSRLGSGISLPKAKGLSGQISVEFNPFGQALYRTVHWTHQSKYDKEISAIRTTLAWIDHGTPRQAEEGTRLLGELLGFKSSRPDNDVGTGPDVHWLDDLGGRQFGLELKSDKSNESTYYKDDINQGLGHVEWMRQNHPEHAVIGLSFVGPDVSTDKQSSPSSELYVITVQALAGFRDKLLALIDDIRTLTPLERAIRISQVSEDEAWSFDNILAQMGKKNLA